jgi:hypothetical protein
MHNFQLRMIDADSVATLDNTTTTGSHSHPKNKHKAFKLHTYEKQNYSRLTLTSV